MRMSISTTSGRRRRDDVDARRARRRPRRRRVMSGSASRITRKPVRSSRWSSAITTVIARGGPRSAAAARSSSSRHARAAPTALGDAAQPQRARRAPSAPPAARPAIWRTTSRGEDLAGVGAASHSAAGDDHRRAVEVVAVGIGSPASRPTRSASPVRGRALHRDRAAHRRDGAGERDHQPVAGRLDLAAAVLGDRGAQRGEVLAAQRVGRLVAARGRTATPSRRGR